MTEIEKKAEENWDKCILKDIKEPAHWAIHEHHVQAYKDGYEQGQKDFDTDVTKLLNSYGVTFIDTNSIGGLIALHQLILDLEKENEELKKDNEYLYKVNDEQMERILDLNDELKNEIAFNEESETVKNYKEQIEKKQGQLEEKEYLLNKQEIEYKAQIEELKATISKMEKVTAEKNSSLLKELTERVKQQAEQIEEYKIGVTERNNEIKDFIAQIEKMKNMQNCKHNWETKGQCVLNNGGYCICEKWELAK